MKIEITPNESDVLLMACRNYTETRLHKEWKNCPECNAKRNLINSVIDKILERGNKD